MTVNKTRPPTAYIQHHPTVGARSRAGARDHDNDDSCDYFVVERADGAGPIYLAIVADGVTNTAGGAQASRIAVETVKATLQESPGRQETLSEWLEFAIVHANDEILFQAKRNPQWQGMSTTIVLAALAGEKLYVMHLGDSRAYLIRGDAIYQLVADHTWAQEAIDMGVLSTEEAAQHPGRNQLLRYLGAQKGLGVDRGIIVPATTQREEYLAAQPGDMILLCSDGLHNRVGDVAIKQIILEHVGYPQDAVDALLEKAVDKGERDDITAILLELPPGHKELPSGVDAPTQSVTPVTPKHGSGLWLLLIVVGALALMTVLLIWLRLG